MADIEHWTVECHECGGDGRHPEQPGPCRVCRGEGEFRVRVPDAYRGAVEDLRRLAPLLEAIPWGMLSDSEILSLDEARAIVGLYSDGHNGHS